MLEMATEVDFTDASVLNECLEWIKEVTKESGKIVKEGFVCSNVNVDFKDDFYDLVTEYDRRTEDYLVGAIRAKYPDHK